MTRQVKSVLLTLILLLVLATGNLFAAIIFVDSTASGANDGTSWTDAYTSLNTALLAANHAPGDQYLVSGTFNEIVNIAEVATQAAQTHVQGDDKSGGAGVGVAVQFVIDGQSTRGNCVASTLNAAIWYVFKNMTCQNATSNGCSLSGESNTKYVDCKCLDNGSDGLKGASHISLEGCVLTGNTGDGVQLTSGSVIACRISSNGADGINAGQVFAAFNELFSNAGTAIHMNSGISGTCFAIHNTIDGDADDTTNGIHQDAATPTRGYIFGNIVYDCATGIRADGDGLEMWTSFNNLLNANTTNYVNAATFSGEVTGAPLFTNEGANDYTLQSGSPAKAAGMDAGQVVNGVAYLDIGAHQREEATGGGPDVNVIG